MLLLLKNDSNPRNTCGREHDILNTFAGALSSERRILFSALEFWCCHLTNLYCSWAETGRDSIYSKLTCNIKMALAKNLASEEYLNLNADCIYFTCVALDSVSSPVNFGITLIFMSH